MAKHEVSLKIEHEIPVGNRDVQIPVKIDGKPHGRLKVSRGGVDWQPSPNSKSSFSLTWGHLAELMEREGTEGKKR